jgi:nitroreductase
MEFSEVIATRRSIRKYRQDPVPAEALKPLYEALRLAPSGANKQSFSFVFVTDETKRKRIAAEAGHQEFIAEAPVIMAAVCEPGGGFDVAIAVDHMVLAAANEGLGSCWVGWFERGPVREILGIPDSKEVPILVALGWPDEAPEMPPRKALENLIMLDQYRESDPPAE